jgi:hypothetical protein
VIAGTANGAQVVANTAKALLLANWSTVCDSAWLTAMGAPGLPAPASRNVFTSQRSLFTAESQPKIGLTVIRTDGLVTDALGALDQTHELEITVCSDWGYYDNTGAHPLTTVTPFNIEAYETAVRAYVEGVVMVLTSPAYGMVNLDARNYTTPGYTMTGIYNALPSSGLTPVDFVVGEDDTGQTLIQQTVRASIQVLQRRSLAR